MSAFDDLVYQLRAWFWSLDLIPPDIGARVYNSANISIPHNTTTIITHDSERRDPYGLHSTVSNTGRFTLVHAGNFHIGGNIRWASAAGGDREFSIQYNGTDIIASVSLAAVSAGAIYQHVSCNWYDCAVGDTFQLLAYHNQGAAVNVVATAKFSPEFWIYKLP